MTIAKFLGEPPSLGPGAAVVGGALLGAILLVARSASAADREPDAHDGATMGSMTQDGIPTHRERDLGVLRAEYIALWRAMQVNSNRIERGNALAQLLARSKARYQVVASSVSMPWYVVAVIHALEGGGSSGQFDKHLLNGDPLTARTVHHPPGRPVAGTPPFTWEQGAADAMSRFRPDLLARVPGWSGWDLAGTLYQLERYNGWGYRDLPTPMHTPYLWSGTNLYGSGKFTEVGRPPRKVFNPSLVSAQIGAAVILKALESQRLIGEADGWRP